MLKLLHIENIAVIESADIEFDDGFNVLTGETGAGKSIIIDSINALLGERVSRELLRAGASKGIVSGVFCNLSYDVKKMSEEYGFEIDGDELILSREIRADGKNICRIGGLPSTVAVMREFGAVLVAVHGQHDTHGLLNENTHIFLLDGFAKTGGVLSEYRQMFSAMNKTKAQLNALCSDERERNIRQETLKFQIEEIAEADISAEEENLLSERRAMLQSSEKLTGALNNAYDLLYGGQDKGICQSLSECSKSLGGISQLSEKLAEIYSRTEELKYASEDILAEVRDMREGFDFSPDELETTERRLDKLYRLKKKYSCVSIEQLVEYYEKICAEYEQMDNSEYNTERLAREYEQQKEQAEQLAAKLSELRNAAAESLAQKINNELAELDMKSAKFSCHVDRLADDAGNIKFCADGCDKVGFYISANIGENEKPLEKVASGGELSRIMLALKNILAEDDSVQTLIFDEIDAGVSGRAAGRIGEKLYSVSCSRQVLCVTHLAQIAVFADNHMLIRKDEANGKTYTQVLKLDRSQRCGELSRIISGRDITENSKNAALEMIELCDKDKAAIKINKGR